MLEFVRRREGADAPQKIATQTNNARLVLVEVLDYLDSYDPSIELPDVERWSCPRCDREPSDDDPNICMHCNAQIELAKVVVWMRKSAQRARGMGEHAQAAVLEKHAMIESGEFRIDEN